MTWCFKYSDKHSCCTRGGKLLDPFFFLLEEFLFHVVCCFPLSTPQMITRLRQILQIGDFVEYELMADVLRILER